LRKRLSHGIDFSASYTLSKGTSNIGNASDELNTANIQDRTTHSTIRVNSGRTARPMRVTASACPDPLK
jgi:hypothetical protein